MSHYLYQLLMSRIPHLDLQIDLMEQERLPFNHYLSRLNLLFEHLSFGLKMCLLGELFLSLKGSFAIVVISKNCAFVVFLLSQKLGPFVEIAHLRLDFVAKRTPSSA